MANDTRDRDNSGIIWMNNRNLQDGVKINPNAPDMRGDLVLSDELIAHAKAHGNKVQLSGWWKHTDNAGDFLSIQAQEVYVKPEEKKEAPVVKEAPRRGRPPGAAKSRDPLFSDD